MKPIDYKEVDVFYEVFITPLKKTALCTILRVDPKTLPEGVYVYDLRHGDDGDWSYPCTIEPKVVVNHFGCILINEEIDFGEKGFIELDEDEFWNTDHRAVLPDEIGDYFFYCDEVTEFIDNFVECAKKKGISYENLRILFMAGYCYYFAEMLKSAFNRGRVYICAPYGHVIWKDDNGVCYDIEGVSNAEYEALVPADYSGSHIIDFKHIKTNIPGASESEIADLVKMWKDK